MTSPDKENNIRNDASKWRLWGRWPNTVLYGSIWPYWGSTSIFKEMQLNVTGYMKLLYGHYFLLKQDMEELRQQGIKSVEGDNSYFKNVFALCTKKTAEFVSLIDSAGAAEDKESLKRFILALRDFAGCTVLVEVTSTVIDPYFKKVCEDAGMSYQEFSAIVEPAGKLHLTRYYERLSNATEADVDDILSEFKWVIMQAFEGEGLTREKVLADMEKDWTKPATRTHEIPKSLERLQFAVSGLMFHRTNLIDSHNKVIFNYRDQLIALGKEHGLTYGDIIRFTTEELLELIDKGRVPDGLRDRTKRFGIINTGGEHELLFGDDFEKEFAMHDVVVDKDVTSVKGMVGHPGKVQGKVKVVNDYADLPLVKEGDILVTTETTVNFEPAMAKAAAFVTNQGGITSHAAIIAREMKKPCIIGTQIATKVFKDGDMVEVDTETGVVKKIE